MAAQYVIGIDLGTTNSALAYVPLGEDKPRIELLADSPVGRRGDGRVADCFCRRSLYLASEHESGGGSFDLPWASDRDFAVGEFARRQAAEVPDRTVGAAKSWLCHSRVDRHQPILPWNAPAEVPKISPVTAAHALPGTPDRRVGSRVSRRRRSTEQHVVLTVPASFDASARELTREAALAAGLPESLVLLEEPQAAVYSWLAAMGDRWRRALAMGDTLLVCDVGGGTTDLTLVDVTEEGGELVLGRKAVGNHLLVGGDNMDLALAYHVAGRFAERGTKLDPWQSVALWHSCRNAKEALLSPDGPEQYTVAVLGRGSKLIGGTVSVEVDRETVAELLVDGFFPRCGLNDRPARGRVSGFREIGLPFESDTAVTRHLAAFLQAHGSDAGGPVRPTHVLFNGGVFKAESLRRRLLDVLGQLVRRRGRSRRCSKARTTWTTRPPGARPTTAGPSTPAACGSAAARPMRITSASRRPGWRFPGRRGPCGGCASCRSAWRRARKPTSPRTKSDWWSASPPISASSARRSAAKTARATCSPRGPRTN